MEKVNEHNSIYVLENNGLVDEANSSSWCLVSGADATTFADPITSLLQSFTQPVASAYTNTLIHGAEGMASPHTVCLLMLPPGFDNKNTDYPNDGSIFDESIWAHDTPNHYTLH